MVETRCWRTYLTLCKLLHHWMADWEIHNQQQTRRFMTPGRYRQRLLLRSQVSKHCEEVSKGRGVWTPPIFLWLNILLLLCGGLKDRAYKTKPRTQQEQSNIHMEATGAPVASMSFVTLHNLLCTRTNPYPITLLPIGSGYFRAKLFLYKYPQHFSNLLILHLPAYEDGTQCSETSAYKIQTLRNYPEESIQHAT